MKRDLRDNARELRATQTDAESHLWYYLRAKRLRGYKFKRQHRIGGFIADFACPSQSLVIELDGGQHADATQYDQHRTARLNAQGYRVIRFWDNEVLQQTETVLEEILRALEAHPSP